MDEKDRLEKIRQNKAALDLARRQALAGDPICAGYFAFESLIRQHPEGQFILDHADYMDDEGDE